MLYSRTVVTSNNMDCIPHKMPVCLYLPRKVEGEIFKLEMLLKDFKEKIYKSKRTSAVSLPVNSPINLDDLSFTSSPPLNEVIQQPTANFMPGKMVFMYV